jgi:hypothetical protein
VETYYVEWKRGMKAGRKGWPVRFEPLECERAGEGPFMLWWWCIRYIKRSYDRKISGVVLSRGGISVQDDGAGKLTHTTRPLVVWFMNGSLVSTYAVMYGTVQSLILYGVLD